MGAANCKNPPSTPKLNKIINLIGGGDQRNGLSYQSTFTLPLFQRYYFLSLHIQFAYICIFFFLPLVITIYISTVISREPFPHQSPAFFSTHIVGDTPILVITNPSLLTFAYSFTHVYFVCAIQVVLFGNFILLMCVRDFIHSAYCIYIYMYVCFVCASKLYYLEILFFWCVG